jgi:uncharacterized membrane protein YhhN
MLKTIFNVIIFISASFAILASYADDQRLYWVLKPATTILVIALVLLSTYRMPNQTAPYRKMIILALLLCLAGDILLLDSDLFAFGLGSFLLAHLLFSYVFYRLSDSQLRLAPLLFLIAMSLAYFKVLEPNLEALLVPVAVYFSVIIFMFWQSLRLCLSRRDKYGYAIAIAATLFVSSDSIIAANKFIEPFGASSALILGLYWVSITIFANLFSGPYLKLDSD